MNKYINAARHILAGYGGESGAEFAISHFLTCDTNLLATKVEGIPSGNSLGMKITSLSAERENCVC